MDGSIQHVYFFLDNKTTQNNKRKDSSTASTIVHSSAYEVPPFDPKERAAMSKRTVATRGASESSSDNSSTNSRYVAHTPRSILSRAMLHSRKRSVAH